MVIKFIVLVLFSCLQLSHQWDYTIERVQNMNSTGRILFNMRCQRINRTTIGVSGKMVYRPPLTITPNLYKLEAKLYQSSGNNQYVLYPIRLPTMTMCEFLNGPYRKFFMEASKPPVTNFPYSEDPNEDLCKQIMSDKDVEHYMKNFYFDKSAMPPYMPAGMFRVHFMVSRDGELDSGLEVLVRITQF